MHFIYSETDFIRYVAIYVYMHVCEIYISSLSKPSH